MLSFQQRLNNTFYVLLSLPATAMGFALCVQIAALSWILNTQYGFDLHQIGIVWAAGPIAGILGQVLIGLISDNVWFWGGRRRPFILIGGTLAALSLLALPNIGLINEALGMDALIGVAITVALTLDLSINISFNPTRSVIADVTPVGDKRTQGYTWMQTISGFFGVLAYLIGAFIGNYVLIYLGALIVFVFSVFPVFFIEEPKVIAATEEKEKIHSSTDLSAFLKICLAHAFTWLGVQTMFVYTFAYIKENIMGFATSDKLPESVNNQIGFATGIAFAILNTVGFILPALVLEPLSRRWGKTRIHTWAIGTMAIGYFLLAFFAPNQTLLFLCMAVIGIGWAAVVSLPFAIMSEVVDQRKMGLFMGLFNLSVVLPQLIASSLGGWIDKQPDKAVIFWVSAVSLGISALLWLLVKNKR